jgi:glycogen operon protein
VEGPTQNPAIRHLRKQQGKNLLTTLFLSQGTPLLLSGDEFLRTQKGNNNAWCQDNEISWVDWTLTEANADVLRFTRMLIELRKRHSAFRRRTFFRGTGPDGSFQPDIIWHGVVPEEPDFSHGSRTLAFALDGSLTGREPDDDFYVACNAWCEEIPFRIPPSPSGKEWRRIIDTFLPSPQDIVECEDGPLIPVHGKYPVAAHSMIVFQTFSG